MFKVVGLGFGVAEMDLVGIPHMNLTTVILSLLGSHVDLNVLCKVQSDPVPYRIQEKIDAILQHQWIPCNKPVPIAMQNWVYFQRVT